MNLLKKAQFFVVNDMKNDVNDIEYFSQKQLFHEITSIFEEKSMVNLVKSVFRRVIIYLTPSKLIL